MTENMIGAIVVGIVLIVVIAYLAFERWLEHKEFMK